MPLAVLVNNRLFELEPRTKVVFGLDRKARVNYDYIASGKIKRGLGIIRMLDGALSMLGPDADTLSEILDDLGKRHVKYGVKAQFYPFMGHAIVHALSVLHDDWNVTLQDAWVEVYDHLCADIMRSTLNYERTLMNKC